MGIPFIGILANTQLPTDEVLAVANDCTFATQLSIGSKSNLLKPGIAYTGLIASPYTSFVQKKIQFL